jgi:hypothetical protein
MRRVIPIAILMLIGYQDKAEAQCQNEPRQITVHGEGEIFVVPDEAVIELGAESIGADLEAVRSTNSETVGRIIQHIEELGVDLGDIQTGQIELDPISQDRCKTAEVTLYRCHTRIFIRLRDLSRFEPVLTGALKNGANRLHGTYLTTSEQEKHREKALLLALKAAKAKATKMSAELGQSIGQPLSVTEEHSGLIRSYGRSGSSVFSGSSSGSELEAFAPGQILIIGRVRVTFELRDSD